MLKPDYEREGVRLYLGDCRDVLPHLHDIDCTITSPPYNQKLDQFKASGFKAEGNSQWAQRISSSYFDSIEEDEYQRIQAEVLDLVFRATRAGGSFFYNHKCRWRNKELLHPIDIVRNSPWRKSIRQEIIWSRDGSVTQNAKMFPPSEERIFWCFKGTWKWNKDANRWMSVWRIDSAKHTDHPVAFPLEIPLRCLLATTHEGDTALDPYMGSGTTGVACVRTGRKFVGIERDNSHFADAVDRISNEINSPQFSFAAETAEVQAELFGANE